MNNNSSVPDNRGPTADDGDIEEEFDALNIREDSEGWNDVEEDVEDLSIQCLLCKQTFSALPELLKHSTKEHDLDLIQVKQNHGLDFYSSIKFVNYVRSAYQAGNSKPDVENSAKWQDERFLQPVLENDALLFSLDDLDDLAGTSDAQSEIEGKGKQPAAESSNGSAPTVSELQAQLANLQSQFDAYREQVSQTLEKRWSDTEAIEETSTDYKAKKYDDQYFESYSYNDIHQVMLQDTIRTDAYRDFIYENKNIFKDKVVMDVGCGTGILSMFCAKAGAKHVFAIDNSAIIDKARQIASENGMLEHITFVRGKAEELDELPGGFKEVDIIVSEWMGYCLFFEAMLPSVLAARDRFLKRRPDGSFEGLMAPSHCSILMAPMADPDWMSDNITFWNDVYGFNMHSMLEGAVEDAVVRNPKEGTIAGSAVNGKAVKVWDLHKTKVEDLHFSAPFKVKLNKDIDALDAWCIWFDITFSPKVDAPDGGDTTDMKAMAKQPGAISFSTGPEVKATHWQSGVCVIERKGTQGKELKAGDVLEGTLQYEKGEQSRALEIEISWADEKGQESGKQLWKMR